MEEDKRNQYGRVLVVSNNGFSETSSNGRTLGNFFIGWPKDKLAQFCISIAEPNMDLCDNYYVVTDKSAMSAFVRFKKACRIPISKALNTEGTTSLHKSGKRTIKTATKEVLRCFVWANKRWKSKAFKSWVDSFNPEIVLVVTSDSIFIHNIAMDLAKERHIPLVMFCTEGYYFFSHSHMRVESIFDNFSYAVYKHFYRWNYKKLMSRVSHVIYGNSKLEEDYQCEFNHNSTVLYTSSSMPFIENDIDLDYPAFSYLGNFSFNRPKALIEIAETLKRINPSYKLDVYGKIETDSIRRQFESCDAISIKGFVSYSEVQSVINKSAIVFHGESQELKYQESLKYGFSTKIADLISSGCCFVMYSSPEIAGARYLIDSGAAWFAQTDSDLECKIREILTNPIIRKSKKDMSKALAKQNHNLEVNCRLFHMIINECINSNE